MVFPGPSLVFLSIPSATKFLRFGMLTSSSAVGSCVERALMERCAGPIAADPFLSNYRQNLLCEYLFDDIPTQRKQTDLPTDPPQSVVAILLPWSIRESRRDPLPMVAPPSWDAIFAVYRLSWGAKLYLEHASCKPCPRQPAHRVRDSILKERPY